jgi:Mg-chelatase subunit ChlD
LELKSRAIFENDFIHVRVSAESGGKRPPAILLCLLDVSGSMESACADHVDAGENAVTVTRLQLVQFSVQTIIKSLDDQDALGLYSFSDETQELLQPTLMDAAGRDLALEAVNSAVADGMTHLWSALREVTATAMTLQNDHPDSTIHVLLFTDGEPNDYPPGGILPGFVAELEGMPERRFTVSTFGFGCDINSHLLGEIARFGGGVYCYCPDSLAVGTTFNNFLAQAMLCAAQGARIHIEAGGEKIDEIVEFHVGQPRNFLVRGDPDRLLVRVALPATQQEIELSEAEPADTPAERDAIAD